jgi:hypothetical protein
MITVTKEFKAMLKNADSFSVMIDNQDGVIYVLKKNIRHEYSFTAGLNKGKACFTDIFAGESTIPVLYHILKMDDQIAFLARSNSNQHLERAELFNDELLISVWRKGKRIINNYPLMAEIGPNDSVRAIKGGI